MKKITINGKAYPCRVTMGAMVRFKRESGKDISEISQSDMAELVLFIWCCAVSACNADDVAFDYTFEKFADSLDPENLAGFYESINSKKKTTNTPTT